MEIGRATLQVIVGAMSVAIGLWDAAAVVGVDLGQAMVRLPESRYRVRRVEGAQIAGIPLDMSGPWARLPAGWLVYSVQGHAVPKRVLSGVRDVVAHATHLEPRNDICAG